MVFLHRALTPALTACIILAFTPAYGANEADIPLRDHLYWTLLMLNLLLCGGVLGLTFLKPTRLSLITAAYTLTGLTALTLLHTSAPEAPGLLYPPLIIVMSAITLALLVEIKKRSHAAYTSPFTATCILHIIPLLLTLSSGILSSPYKSLANNSLLYALPIIALCLLLGLRTHMTHSTHHDHEQINRQRRASEALKRLQPSQDAIDQARLIRVIEQERELMQELRDKEQDRAEEMRRAKQEADRANAAKSAFLAMISHEIRTPMNGIMGILKLLQTTPIDDEQTDYVLTMQKTGDTMVALLNDILDFEKIEKGAMDLEHIPIDLHTIVKGIITLMSGYKKGKTVELRSHIDPTLPRTVMGDPTRLQQILLNLVGNALKFTHEGTVTIALTPATPVENRAENPEAYSTHAITFAVEDTGIGIAEEAQKNLFEPFKQAERSTTREYGGTGLGLAICMRLVEAMKGALKIKSTLGEGTHFYFTLTMKAAANSVSTDQTTQTVKSIGPAPPHTPARPLDISLVEDNEINRKVVSSLLEKEGHTVFGFPSAEEFLNTYTTLTTDVLITDINLPGKSGLDLARILRTTPDTASLPIIALSGNITADDIAAMKDAGMNTCLGKPLDYDALTRVLSRIEKAQPKPNPTPANPSDAMLPYTPAPLTNAAPPNTDKATTALDPTHYDTKILNTLKTTLGKETLADLLDGCFTEIDTIIDAITPKDKHLDFGFIYARMHELKGMSLNFGLTEVGRLAGQMEAAAKEQDHARIPSTLPALVNAGATAHSTITGWLADQE